MTETDAIIREIEEQRTAMATRAAKFAGMIAVKDAEMAALRKSNAEKHERITALEAEVAALKSPQE